MRQILRISDLPQAAAVYALYGGEGSSLYVAYIGVADRLRRRIEQHLIRRDSSVAVGTSAVGINPAHISQVRWWEHHGFDDRSTLEAAELIATELLDPVLRSRGRVSSRALKKCEDDDVRKTFRALFSAPATGTLKILGLNEVIERMVALEERIANLERRFEELP